MYIFKLKICLIMFTTCFYSLRPNIIILRCVANIFSTIFISIILSSNNIFLYENGSKCYVVSVSISYTFLTNIIFHRAGRIFLVFRILTYKRIFRSVKITLYFSANLVDSFWISKMFHKKHVKASFSSAHSFCRNYW